jgi:hypothetical protein
MVVFASSVYRNRVLFPRKSTERMSQGKGKKDKRDEKDEKDMEKEGS